jgi:hypothetical protein
MPLSKGTSRKTFEKNVRQIVRDWEKDGTIGNSRPKTKKKAIEQAVAIAYRIQREAKRKKKE